MGVLGGNKWPDNTDIMRENERDDSRADTGGGLGGEGRGKKNRRGEMGCGAV